MRPHRPRGAGGRCDCEAAEYWIVDVVGQELERYTAPVDGVYTKREVFRAGDTISPLRFPDTRFALDEIL